MTRDSSVASLPQNASAYAKAAFYARDTVLVARDLLGCVLETEICDVYTAGRIVEVEAYVGPDDPAAHGYGNRRTARNAALFGPPGTSYVYFIYGAHWCFNVVTERDGFPAAVLVRAVEPIAGQHAMAERRGTDRPRLLCAGPGRLCQALGITGALDGVPLTEGSIRVARPQRGNRVRVGRGARVGISRAVDWPLRFYIENSPWLSRRG